MSKQMIFIVVAIGMFMEALDTTILNTAVPTMSQHLHVNPIDLKMALISYLVSLAVFIPISGWAADRFGAKKVFIFAMGIFTVSSYLCGFATNLLTLIFYRMLQGLGGALMVPVGRLITLRCFPRHELIVIQSRIVMIGAIGMMIGPALGGLITQHASWQWIFWVNIPVGILNIVVAIYYLPLIPTIKSQSLDKLGFILFSTALAGLTFSLSALSESEQNLHVIFMVLLLAIASLILYFWHSRIVQKPILNLSLFRYRTFTISILGNLLARLGFGSVPFLLPLLFQIVLGYTAEQSGLLSAPAALAVILVKPFSVYILRFFGYRKFLMINTWFVGIALWSLMLVGAQTPWYFILFLIFTYGFLNTLQYTAMNSLAYSGISTELLSSATSILSTTQQLAQSFGVAIGALLLRCFTHLSNSHLLLSETTFKRTFFILGFLTLSSALVFRRLSAADGTDMIS